MELIDGEESCIGGIVARLQRRLADEFDQVIVNHIAIGVGGIPLDSANPPHYSYIEPGFLANLPNDGLLSRFAWLDSAAGEGPLALRRGLTTLNEQKASRGINTCGTHTWDIHQVRIL
jgi:hypothetical protein